MSYTRNKTSQFHPCIIVQAMHQARCIHNCQPGLRVVSLLFDFGFRLKLGVGGTCVLVFSNTAVLY